jgi:mono/diheme cytochrome c family protein
VYRVVRTACVLGVVAGCGQSMTRQAKLNAGEPSDLWSSGTSSRPLPQGVVSQTDLDLDHDAATPPSVSAAFLQHGQERYDIFCTPCHGFNGEGNGMIVQRGFPAPPSYHIARLRSASAQYLFDVITNGHGVMYSYANRVAPRDRWAIVAYIRALQTSRTVALEQAPGAQEKLPP